MSVEPTDDLSGRTIDAGLLRRLLRFARPHWNGFLASTGLLLLISGLMLAGPLVLRSFVDAALSTNSTLDEERKWRSVVQGGILLCVLGGTTFLLRYLQITLTNRTGQRVIHDLRQAVFRHLSTRNLRYFDRNPVGTLVTRVTNDIETLNEFFVSGVDVLLFDLVRIIGIVFILFQIDVQMALTTLAVVPFVLAWAFVFQRRARKLFREVRKEVGSLNASMNEYLGGMRVIRLFSKENAVADRFAGMNQKLRVAHVNTVWNFSWFFPGLEFLPAVGTALVLIVAHGQVQGGDLTVGGVIAFWSYLGLFIDPLKQIADKFNILQAAVAAGERVFKVLDDQSALPDPKVPKSPESLRGDVIFEDVHFSYDGKKRVLEGVSFHAKPGTRLAIVGATGSGKSTIISLLGRLYDPDRGRILLDGVALCEYDPPALRRQIGVVLQDVFLFDGTVRENLGLGNPALNDDKLLAAADATSARPVIDRLGGLEGRIRERGATLSSGEKQLLAFARALAQDPALLVLDEATAHVDSQTEALVRRALRRICAGRTSVLIAHRLSTVQDCDQILVVHHGQIRERGHHAELLALNGIYARLHRLQFEARSSASVDPGGP